MLGPKISKDKSGRIVVSFPYNSSIVTKIKAIEGRRWHPVEKHWSFPNRDNILEKILEVFGDKEIQIDPALKNATSKANPVRNSNGPSPRRSGSGHAGGGLNPAGIILKSNPTAEQRGIISNGVKDTPSPLAGEGQSLPRTRYGGEGYHFEDLRRELVSRKYSYKTVKGYTYYNKDFLDFTDKEPSEVNDDDIKDYLLYLAEEKESATATINQAINALKFYYGTILKKKFFYEIKRPRKDKKLPVVLSQEEVAKILSSVDNVKHRAILMLVYSAGLRVGEVVKLKIEDIDSQRMLIHIIKVQRAGKIDIPCFQRQH